MRRYPRYAGVSGIDHRKAAGDPGRLSELASGGGLRLEQRVHGREHHVAAATPSGWAARAATSGAALRNCSR